MASAQRSDSIAAGPDLSVGGRRFLVVSTDKATVAEFLEQLEPLLDTHA